MKPFLAVLTAVLVAAIPGAVVGQSDWDAAALEAELRQALATVAGSVGDIAVTETDTGIQATVSELRVPNAGWDVVFPDVVITGTPVDATTIDFDLAFAPPGTPARISEPAGIRVALTYGRASATGSWSVPMRAVSAFDITLDRAILRSADTGVRHFSMSAATMAVSSRVSASADGDWHVTETSRFADLHVGQSQLTLATMDHLELLLEVAGDDWPRQHAAWRTLTWPQQPFDNVADVALPESIRAAVVAEGVLIPLAGTLGADKLHLGTAWDMPNAATATVGLSMALEGLSPGLARGYLPAPYLGMLPESGALDITIGPVPSDLAREMVLASITQPTLRRSPHNVARLIEALDGAGTTMRLDRFEAVAPEGGVRAEGVAAFDVDAVEDGTISSRVTLIGLDELIDRVVAARHLSLDARPLIDLREDGVALAPERGLSVYEYLIEMAADGLVTVNGEVRP